MAEHQAAAAVAAERPVSRAAAVAIAFIWISSIALGGGSGVSWGDIQTETIDTLADGSFHPSWGRATLARAMGK